MFWWFEREGAYLRCEVLELPAGGYELRVIREDGSEQVERFSDATALAVRQQKVVDDLEDNGWSGPHGWVL